jgi:hypothetical protein
MESFTATRSIPSAPGGRECVSACCAQESGQRWRAPADYRSSLFLFFVFSFKGNARGSAFPLFRFFFQGKCKGECFCLDHESMIDWDGKRSDRVSRDHTDTWDFNFLFLLAIFLFWSKIWEYLWSGFITLSIKLLLIALL